MFGKVTLRHRSSPWHGAARFVFVACLALCACSGFFLLDMKTSPPSTAVQQEAAVQNQQIWRVLQKHRHAMVRGLHTSVARHSVPSTFHQGEASLDPHRGIRVGAESARGPPGIHMAVRIPQGTHSTGFVGGHGRPRLHRGHREPPEDAEGARGPPAGASTHGTEGMSMLRASLGDPVPPTLHGVTRNAPGVDCSRGVPPEEAAVFCCTGTFSCGEGAPAIPCTAVNDNYCDCLSGADEPGTSACSPLGTRFRCPDGLTIPSSLVDDGICDCCDGADEVQSSTCKSIASCADARALL